MYWYAKGDCILNNSKTTKFIEKTTSLMTVSVVIWFLIIIYQFFIGLITLIFGYGFATLLVMGYNIFSVVRYIKTINFFRKNAGHIQITDFIDYFEKNIPVAWLFLFVNLLIGGFFGFIGCLYDLILSYYVKGKRGELLMPESETEIIEDYEE